MLEGKETSQQTLGKPSCLEIDEGQRGILKQAPNAAYNGSNFGKGGRGKVILQKRTAFETRGEGTPLEEGGERSLQQGNLKSLEQEKKNIVRGRILEWEGGGHRNDRKKKGRLQKGGGGSETSPAR